MSETSYHHGDLRAALLCEAEAELTEHGVERFSLRGVAKRAGVSHAAPAHHFGDKTGLLTALAAIGFERFLAAQKRREALAPDDPAERLVASGLGYIDYAMANPALFRLMFASKWVAEEDPTLCEVASAAFTHLADAVSAVTGPEPMEASTGQTVLVGAWAVVHGLADLMLTGRPKALMSLDDAEREAMIRAIVSKFV
ncbi:MAG: TetR/AcrR family transcriptional regulator [Pseudomonadota bacterium]